MRKYFEAGLISFICCAVLGIALSGANQPNPASLEPPAEPAPVVQAQPTSPKVPEFTLASNLPTLTPEETRSKSPYQFDPSSLSDEIAQEADVYPGVGGFEYVSPEDKQFRIEIDQSNYGDRQLKDAQGNIVQNDILVVLHETTSSAESAVHTFLTHHPNDANQVSYHALILLDGRIVHLVPPEKRAYGAGNSEFKSDVGVEAVQTNPKYPSSVNNFAYHISLETPLDAQNMDVANHSGYTADQYESLAWLINALQVPANRVTTHRAVDRNFDRTDPRSFDMSYLGALLY